MPNRRARDRHRKPGQRVLDIGCGTGAVLTRAAVAVAQGGHVTGIDPAPRMLERAAAEARRRRLANTGVCLGSAGHTPSAPGAFDTVLSSLVLHLLPDPGHALRHWLRLLVPGGTAGFSWAVKPDPRWSPVFHAVDRHAGNMAGFEERLCRLDSPRRIRGLLSHCGYVLVVRRKMPGAELEIARREAFEMLDTVREPDGSLMRRAEMGFAIAHRPAVPPAKARKQWARAMG